MSDRATRLQVKLIAVMVLLMWWAFFVWHRPTMLPSREEKRRVFPPGALDPNRTYQHLRYHLAGTTPHPLVPGVPDSTSLQSDARWFFKAA